MACHAAPHYAAMKGWDSQEPTLVRRIRTPGGVLKIKRRDELRSDEKDGGYPVLRIGPLYVLWSSDRRERMIGRYDR